MGEEAWPDPGPPVGRKVEEAMTSAEINAELICPPPPTHPTPHTPHTHTPHPCGHPTFHQECTITIPRDTISLKE